MSLVNELIKGLLPEEEKQITTAVYAGGFKPPTSGHFEVVKKALEENPEIDEFIIFIGAKERDGISQDESLLIWEIYNNYLPFKVKIEPTSIPPIKAVYDYAKNHPTREVLWIIGAREGNEEDFKDITSRTSSISKYPNLELRTIVTAGGVSGTAARNAAKISFEKFEKFIPDVLSPEEKQEAYNLVSGKIQEVGEANVSSYKWKETKKTSYSISYEFTTDSGVDYLVKFNDNDDDEDIDSLEQIRDWDISFFSKSKVDSDGEYSYSSSQVVNKGELFRVMSTIVDITKNVIKQFPNTKKLSFQPSPSKGDDTVDNQRGRLYKAFISKQLPQAKIDQEGSTVTINLPEKISLNEDKIGGTFDRSQYYLEYYKKLSPSDFSLDLSDNKVIIEVPSSINPINENASYTTTIDIVEKIAQLTNHMIKKGMNIEPLPTVEFIDNDIENAKNFLGKTAYYDPERKHIVLYTEGRHPKDIVRSYAHEMIHHIQNLEGRLGNINTTNTMEDDHLNNLEAEANLKGTMTFRNWTDSIQESKKKDPFGLNAYAQELARLREIKYSNPNFDAEWKEAIRYPEFNNMGKESWIRTARVGQPVSYSSIKDVLGNVDLNFVDLEAQKKHRFLDAYYKGIIEMPIAVKFSDTDYDLVAGNTRLAGLVRYGIDPKIWVVDISSLKEGYVLQNLEDKFGIDLDLHDDGKALTLSRIVIPKEKRGQGIGSKIMNLIVQYADTQNKPIYLTPTKDFGATSTGRLEQFYKQFGFKKKDKSDFSNRETMVREPLNEKTTQNKLDKSKVKIYLDMDGVLSDFNQRFRSLAGMEPDEFESKYGKTAFWDFIDEGNNKIRFWVGIPVMNGAKELVDLASKYNYSVLTAPSAKKQSRLGKSLWIRNHTGDLFPSKPSVIFKRASEKHLVKPELTKNDILVDDKKSTIDNWNAAGGTGIFYKNISQVLNDLGKLGL